jgi:CspA family cold shock protein
MAGSAARVSGTVKWFNAERGFGFLTPDDGRADVHVSIKNVRGRATLRAGGKVSFVRRDGLKGPWATDVMPIT